MLVLSRKHGESIRIGPEITITLVAVKGGGAKIAIEAPPNVRILRGELCGDGEDLRPLAAPSWAAAEGAAHC